MAPPHKEVIKRMPMKHLYRSTKNLIIRPLGLKDYESWRESLSINLERQNPWDRKKRESSELSKNSFKSVLSLQKSQRDRDEYYDLTVFENLVVGGYSRPYKEQAENIDLVVDIFPRLLDRQRQLAGSLSGGEQQMLAFGRAMMSNPSLMLVDELSLGLMPSVVDECYNALGKLVEKGIAVILVDQNSDAAMGFCSNSLILETGHQLWYGKSLKAPEKSIY